MRRTTSFSLLIMLAACGSDNGDDGGPDAGGNDNVVTFTAEGDVQNAVQSAFINATEGQTFVFSAGTYNFTDELSLVGKKKITIRGAGSDRAAVVWSFAGVGAGNANGFSAEGVEDLVIENLTVIDAPGDGLRVQNSDKLTFRNLHIRWSAGSVSSNGAYAIYPVHSKNILVEGCLVEGASDAGIYVGQSETTMIRNNTVRANVTGIEVENTDDAEVVNNTATDNVAGILVFNLPNLPRKTGSRTVVHGNTITDNNRPQFAHGGVVALLPSGTGMVLLANDNTEVRDNTITGNGTAAFLIFSCQTVDLLAEGALGCADPQYDGYPETVHIHDNTISGNATMGEPPFFSLWAADIIWDGRVDAAKPASDALKLCIRGNGAATFTKVSAAFGVESRDLTPHDCSHPAVSGVTVTWGQ